MNFILSGNINEECKLSKSSKELRKSLLYCFTRLCKLAPKDSDFSVVNNEFNDFISDLFYSIQKNKIQNFLSGKDNKFLHKTNMRFNMFPFTGSTSDKVIDSFDNILGAFLRAVYIDYSMTKLIFYHGDNGWKLE